MKKTWIFLGLIFTALVAWGASDRVLNTYQLIFKESGGANTMTVQPASMSSDFVLTLPVDDGTNGQVLSTNGSGVLSWSTVSTTAWNQDGNTVGSEKWIGTADNFDFPIRSNNVERISVNAAGTTSFLDATDSTSTTTGSVQLAGGLGVVKRLNVGGTINLLGTGATTASGYTSFSGNLYTSATGTSDTEKSIRLASNTYNAANGPTRSTSLTGGQIELTARSASTNGTILFRANTTADGATTSPTLIGFSDANGKWTFGASGASSDHQINGSLNTTHGVAFSASSPGNTLLTYHWAGTFAPTIVGYASPPSITCHGSRVGNKAHVSCPGFTGTSNAITLRIPLPAQLQSTIPYEQEFIARMCTDNGAGNSAPGCLVFIPATTGTYIDLRFNYTSGTSWTASGTKAFNPISIEYLIQ